MLHFPDSETGYYDTEERDVELVDLRTDPDGGRYAGGADGSTADVLMPATVLQFSATEGEKFREGFERRILHTRDLMTVVLDIDNGPWAVPDPYHSHPHEQITYLAEGEILFLAEGQEAVRMTAGDLFAVPSGVPHSIQLLSTRARLVDTFNPVREEFL